MTDEQIFEKAVRIDVGERQRFLVGACDTIQQRERVAALLAAHEQSDSFLDTEAMGPVDDTMIEQPIRKTIGDFEIIRELGRGGMGVVYEARQKSLKRKVALKVLSSGLGLSGKAILRFRREAEAAGKLHHTNIVPIYTTGEDNGVHYYAMELIDGPSLDAVIRDLKQEATEKTEETDPSEADADVPCWLRMTALYQATGQATTCTDSSPIASSSAVAQGSKYFDQIATMIAEVADALDHAHDHGVIHRDVKPSNLLLASDGRLSINDFGLARMLEQPGMTMTGEFVGSPLYMSPEQITAGRAPLDHRTDIYSLGETLYEMLTLQPPFPGLRRDQVIGQILHKEASSPRKLNHRVPVDLNTICLRAIEKDPDKRYQTAGHLARDLRAYVNRHAISIKKVGPVEKLVRWTRKHPSTAALIVVTIFSLAVFTALILTSRNAELKQVKKLVFVYAMGGDFAEAEQNLRRAEDLWASEGWLNLMRGQIELFRGDFELAREHLTNARSELGRQSLTIESLLTISYFYAEDEEKYLRELLSLQQNVKGGLLVPTSDEDLLFFGLVHTWANPIRAVEILDEVAEKSKGNRIAFLVRATANRLAAMEVNDDSQRAIDYALSAVQDSERASVDLDTSSYAHAEQVFAHTTAAYCYREAGDTDKQELHLDAAERAFANAADLPENKVMSLPRFALLSESGNLSESLAYMRSLDDHEIGSVLRTHRLIWCIADGDINRANADCDSFGHFKEQKEPFQLFVELSASKDDAGVANVRRRVAKIVQDYQARDVGFHLDFVWALCRLLDLRKEAEICERMMSDRIAQHRGTFYSDILTPLVNIQNGEAPTSIIKDSGKSRRMLGYALFGLGIDALSNGDRDQAREYLTKCSTEGFYSFYIIQLSRALEAKLDADEDWPTWIEEQAGSEP